MPTCIGHADRGPAGRAAAAEPAGLDSRQLPDPRVLQEPAATGGAAGQAARAPCANSTSTAGRSIATPSSRWWSTTRSMRWTTRCARPGSTRARGFFNGTSLFLQVHGQETLAHRLELVAASAAARLAAGHRPGAGQGEPAWFRHLPGARLRRTGGLPGGDGRLLAWRFCRRRRAPPLCRGRRRAQFRRPATARRHAQDLRSRDPPLAWQAARPALAASRRTRTTCSCSTWSTMPTAGWSIATPPR